ncbi:MAG: hypothetical protein ACM3QW_08105 [Ignavibacteriales bacterium]
MQDKNRLLAVLLMKAALPLMKILVQDDPKLAHKYKDWNRTIQFEVKNDEVLACFLQFVDGQLEYFSGRHPDPQINFVFKNPSDFNALMSGGIAVPNIRGALKNLGTLIGFLPLMLGLTLLLPNKLPKDQAGRAKKVKLLLYFISVALSQLNRAGDEDMTAFTRFQPDRIYQWSVEPDGPAAYLRICKGRTKAGKGIYTRRKPFVHMIFSSIDSAFLVLTGQIDNVEAMKKGMMVTDGSPEYGKDLASIMMKINDMLA